MTTPTTSNQPTGNRPANHCRHWRDEELTRLFWEADNYVSDPHCFKRLADRFGRTPIACRQALRRQGWTYKQASGYLTLQEVADLLDVLPGTLLQLITRGHFIPSVKRHSDRKVAHRISIDDLWDWLEDMRSWHIWQPERLREPAWRSHFGELRRDWLSTAEAAALLGETLDYVRYLRRIGRLPGHKPSNRAAWYRRQDLLAYLATCRTCAR